MSTTTVHAAFAPELRGALLHKLGDACGDISDATSLRDMELRQDRLAEPLERFDAYRSAIDAIGWEASETEIDADLHRWALTTALGHILEIEREYADVDPQLDGAAKQRERATKNVREIEAFAAAAGLRL